MSRTIAANGEKIKQLRAERGWDQQDLTTKAGVSLATVQNVEQGEPTFRSTLTKIAKALGLKTYQDLLEGVYPKRYEVVFKLSIPSKDFDESKQLKLLIYLLQRLVGGEEMEPTVGDGSTLITIPMTEQQIQDLIQLLPRFRMDARGVVRKKLGFPYNEHERDILMELIDAIVEVRIPDDARFVDAHGQTIAIDAL